VDVVEAQHERRARRQPLEHYPQRRVHAVAIGLVPSGRRLVAECLVPHGVGQVGLELRGAPAAHVCAALV
jgi:hypothetical protein